VFLKLNEIQLDVIKSIKIRTTFGNFWCNFSLGLMFLHICRDGSSHSVCLAADCIFWLFYRTTLNTKLVTDSRLCLSSDAGASTEDVFCQTIDREKT